MVVTSKAVGVALLSALALAAPFDDSQNSLKARRADALAEALLAEQSAFVGREAAPEARFEPLSTSDDLMAREAEYGLKDPIFQAREAGADTFTFNGKKVSKKQIKALMKQLLPPYKKWKKKQLKKGKNGSLKKFIKHIRHMMKKEKQLAQENAELKVKIIKLKNEDTELIIEDDDDDDDELDPDLKVVQLKNDKKELKMEIARIRKTMRRLRKAERKLKAKLQNKKTDDDRKLAFIKEKGLEADWTKHNQQFEEQRKKERKEKEKKLEDMRKKKEKMKQKMKEQKEKQKERKKKIMALMREKMDKEEQVILDKRDAFAEPEAWAMAEPFAFAYAEAEAHPIPGSNDGEDGKEAGKKD